MCSLRRVFRSQALINPGVLLPTGRVVEAFGTPKHCLPCGCHRRPSPNHFGLGLQREPDGIRRELPRCRQNHSCAWPLHAPCDKLTASQLSEGLNFLHSCDMIHGDLKGVRDLDIFRQRVDTHSAERPRGRRWTCTNYEPRSRNCHSKPGLDTKRFGRARSQCTMDCTRDPGRSGGIQQGRGHFRVCDGHN